MGHTDFAAMACPIARSMAVLGERWAILILREAYYGSTRFDDFQRNLGIAPNILSARLKTLVGHGMLERAPVNEGSRLAYQLTDKARDFFPAFVALKAWADRWMCGENGPLTVLMDRQTGKEVRASDLVRADGTPVTHDAVRVVAGSGAGAMLRKRFGDAAEQGRVAETIATTGERSEKSEERGHA